jgi:hypothetical protein
MFDSNLLDLVIKQRQQDVLDQASRDHQAGSVRRSRSRSGGLQSHLLGGLGSMLIALGHRLQSRYAENRDCANSLGSEPRFSH